MNIGFDAIAAALNVQKRTIERRALKESWPFEEVGVRGGRRRLFPVDSLPTAVRRAVERWQQLQTAAEETITVSSILNEIKARAKQSRDERIERGVANLTKLRDELAPGVSQRMDYRFEIVRDYRDWFNARQPMKRSVSWEAYAAAYNSKQTAVPAHVLAILPEVSARSVQRWVLTFEKDGLAGLIDQKDGKAKRDVNVFTRQPALEKTLVSLLVARSHLSIQSLLDLLQQAGTDAATGQVLFELPSYHQVYRYVTRWKRDHAEVLTASTNPDAWKNSYMVAFGDASEDVHRLNQRWEMDATPADFMLTDPDGREIRYSASVVIQVHSRRMIAVLAPTPKTETHKLCLRQALLAWGVPEEIVTDNGKDYQSADFQETLRQLDIHHHTTGPFSPWEKPHIERGIQTILHSVLEGLDAFIGHSVAERSAIEAKRSFAERLFKKDAVVSMALPATRLQQLINDWLVGTYEHRQHGSLGDTPFAVAAASRDPIRLIQDERALDILLAQPAGKGRYVVTKKGLTIKGANYIAAELALHVGREVSVRHTEDLGRLVVYRDGEFVCIAECPERTGVSRKEIAAYAREKQRESIQAQRKAIRATKVNPDSLVQAFVESRAQAAGKLTQLPGASIQHDTQALAAAAAASRALEGQAAESAIPNDLQQILAARKRAAEAGAVPAVPPPASNVHVIPETPQQRFRKWLELDQFVAKGGTIDNPRLVRWYGTYPQTPEHASMKKRHQESLQAASTTGAGTVAPVRRAFNH